uniref:E3 ubiquitin-protein ligase rnf213-alpha-like n=1 Tax=Styela clava TaxID=7725 RepID=UPI00193A976F
MKPFEDRIFYPLNVISFCMEGKDEVKVIDFINKLKFLSEKHTTVEKQGSTEDKKDPDIETSTDEEYVGDNQINEEASKATSEEIPPPKTENTDNSPSSSSAVADDENVVGEGDQRQQYLQWIQKEVPKFGGMKQKVENIMKLFSVDIGFNNSNWCDILNDKVKYFSDEDLEELVGKLKDLQKEAEEVDSRKLDDMSSSEASSSSVDDHYSKTDFILVEFRALTQEKSLKIKTNYQNNMTTMQKSQKCKYFSCKLKFPKDFREIQYKYYKDQHAEILLNSNSPSILRHHDLSKEARDCDIILYDSVTLKNAKNFGKLIDLLPPDFYIDSNIGDLLSGIYNWTHTMLTGWKLLNNGKLAVIRPVIIEVEDALTEWTKKLLKRRIENSMNKIFVGHAIANAFFKGNVVISKEDLLENLFQLMNTEKLTSNEYETLFVLLKENLGEYWDGEKSFKFTMEKLFCNPKLIPTFLLALPFYWTIQADIEGHSIHENTGIVLPSENNTIWTNKENAWKSDKNMCKALKRLKPSINLIAKRYPQICNVYMLFLDDKSQLAYVEERGTLDWHDIINKFQNCDKHNGKVYNEYLENEFKSHDDSLSFLINWQYAVGIIGCQLSEKNKKFIDDGENAFRALVEKLRSGQIISPEFRLLRKNARQCRDLYQCFMGNPVDFDVLIESWHSANKSYVNCLSYIEMYIQDCEKLCSEEIDVELEDLKELLSEETDDSMTLNEMAEKRKLRTCMHEYLDDIERTGKFKNCTWFTFIWELIANEKMNHLKSQYQGVTMKISWQKIAEEILRPAEDRLSLVAKQISEGTIILKEIPYLLGDISENFLAKDLEILSSVEKINDIYEAERQLKDYLSLMKSLSAIHLLNQIKKELELEGNFSSLSEINESLLEVDLRNMEKLPDICKGFSHNDSVVMEAFLSQKELIKWMLEKFKKSQDIRTFRDLARTKVGDEQIELDRISVIHSAFQAFSPLLLDLNKINEANILKSTYSQVQSAYENDNSILKNWRYAGIHLSWISDIYDIIGSSGKHAMEVVQEINDNGMYILQIEKERAMNLNSCIVLKMDNKKKSFAELRDLQSRLTLISGEKEDVEQVTIFVNLLTAVESLALSCIQLSELGCLLFANFRVTISKRKVDEENPERIESTFTITISLNKDTNPITGVGSLGTIDDIIVSMREILERWKDHLEKTLLQYYFLNEFSITQLTYLCEALGQKTLSNISDKTKMLLAQISQDTTKTNIKKALEKSTEVADMEEDRDKTNRTDSQNVDEIDNKRHAVRDLCLKRNIPEKLARAAVAANGNDVNKCVRWTILNKTKHELVEKFYQEFQQKLEWAYTQKKLEPNYEVLSDRDSKTLEQVLKRLQLVQKTEDGLSISIRTLYEAFIAQTTFLSLEGLLSLKHLGKFLYLLAKTQSPDRIPNRKLVAPCLQGKVNVVIRDEHEILLTIISLYAAQREECLPTTSEIMICHEKTSIAELTRFFKRVLCKCDINGSPIFCLAATQKLPHNVSEMAGNIFHELLKRDKTEEYQLVIISCDRRHYLSNCFEQDHTPVFSRLTDQQISDYLCDKLKSDIPCETSSEIVRVVMSDRSGLGKSLHIHDLQESMTQEMERKGQKLNVTTIRYMEKLLDVEYFTARFIDGKAANDEFHFIHLDLTPAVKEGLLQFVFNLFILGCIEDNKGNIWRRNKRHFYAVEVTDFNEELSSINQFWGILPNVRCLSPCDIQKGANQRIMMNHAKLESEIFQRPAQYLLKYDNNPDSLDDFRFDPASPKVDERTCLNILLKHCSIDNPSWAQVQHFAAFLDLQFRNCENSIFCMKHVSDLDGLKLFAVKFMILMSQDFSTPSLIMADTSKKDAEIFQQHKLRRKWEEQSHPFVFFNDDQASMTFIDVNINNIGDLVDQKGDVLEKAIIPYKYIELIEKLKKQGVLLNDQFENLTRKEKLKEICKVMGVPVTDCSISNKLLKFVKTIRSDGKAKIGPDYVEVVSQQHLPLLYHLKRNILLGSKFEEIENVLGIIAEKSGIEFRKTEVPDPDPTYELTTNNVLKMLAIYMRFLCNIPVIIMGETGCGKTRMIKFMSELKRGTLKVQNLMTLRVHGGTSVSDVHKHIERAERRAGDNFQNHKLKSILFFDEANTTEAIYAIKEALCDFEKKYSFGKLLQIVAACNPYKKLTDDSIKNLNQAGLGYNVQNAQEHLGSIPMRYLVYRVVPIPPSMQPFIWDFGQLQGEEEKKYINQLVMKLDKDLPEALQDSFLTKMTEVLYLIQAYMRKQMDECKYVSLRDVERCMTAYKWFYTNMSWLMPGIQSSGDEEHKATLVLLQVIGFCYHVSLENRTNFRKELSTIFNHLFGFRNLTEDKILSKFTACQSIIVDGMKVGKNISKNSALKENIFVMALCAEMKIPLFLIGKPGSSKSLAKTIISDNMHGANSESSICKKFKEVEISTFQCSALTRAEEIEGIFSQSNRVQSGHRNYEKYVAVVVLDEIGLAEDSSHMPLKVLHSLLETGTVVDDLLETKNNPSKRIGFVGISNWSLDPAKMNRGIFVCRGKPDKEELMKTTEGIFDDCPQYVKNTIHPVIKALINAYLKVYETDTREYFGLRDLYSLMKMVKHLGIYCFENRQDLKMNDVMNAVYRNFSGGQRSCISDFEKELKEGNIFFDFNFAEPSIYELLEENLKTENRYLLLLTKQHPACDLLNVAIPGNDHENRLQVIFGSAFPGDKNYAALCRNVNKIKACMETACTAVIINLDEIHESLYDALNQHYVTLSNYKYVNLGFGSSEHRVQCRVHDDFRMIFLEEKDHVYNHYPIPLVNRLEKHHFTSERLLSEEQRKKASSLEDWARKFCVSHNSENFYLFDTFIGYNSDTGSSIVLVSDAIKAADVDLSLETVPKDPLEPYKHRMLLSATIDGVFRLYRTSITKEADDIRENHLKNQQHDTLLQFLDTQCQHKKGISLFEVTTFSDLLLEKDRKILEEFLPIVENSIMVLSIHQFDTILQYSNRLDDFFRERKFLKSYNENTRILLIQCVSAHNNRELIACAHHCLMNKLRHYQIEQSNVQRLIIAFLLSTTRKCNSNGSDGNAFSLQHTTTGKIVYVDEMRPSTRYFGHVNEYFNKSLPSIFQQALHELPDSDTSAEHDQTSFDISILLRASLCEAICKVESQATSRNEELIKILMKLFKRKQFFILLWKKMVSTLEEREEELKSLYGDKLEKSWMVDQACSTKNLLEGGSFRKTIWIFMKSIVSKLLACITSIADVNSNFDMLLQDGSEEWQTDLWMNIFSGISISWKDVKHKEKFNTASDLQFGKGRLHIPFSYLFLKELEHRFNIFDEHRFVASLGDWCHMAHLQTAYKSFGHKFLSLFIQDIITMVYVPGSQLEKESFAVEHVVEILANKFSHTKTKPLENSIFMVLYIRSFLPYFSAIFKIWPELIANSKQWVEQEHSIETVLQYAFKDVCAVLYGKSNEISRVDLCVAWVNEVYFAKKIFSSFLDEREFKSSLWRGVSLLYLFLTQLMPNNPTSEMDYNYLEVISKEAEVLAPVILDIENVDGVTLMCSVLSNCYEDVRLKILLSWSDIQCPICSGRIHDPVKLDCDDNHYICGNCFETSESTTCNRCPQNVSQTGEETSRSELILTEEQDQEIEEFKLKCTSFFLNYVMNYMIFDDKSVLTEVSDLLFNEIFLPQQGNLVKTALDFNVMMKSLIMKLLMKINGDDVVRKVDQYLSSCSPENKKLPILYILKYFEDIQTNCPTIEVMERCVSEIKTMEIINMQMLEKVAMLRVGLNRMALQLQNVRMGKMEEREVSEILTFLSNEGMRNFREYFTKVGCSIFGSKWLKEQLNKQYSSLIFPSDFLHSLDVTDYWKFLGDKYCPPSIQNLKGIFLKLMDFERLDDIAPILSCMMLTLHDDQMKRMVNKQLKSLPQDLDFFKKQLMVVLRIFHSPSYQDNVSLFQLMVLVVIAVSKQKYLLDSFKMLIQDTDSVKNLYLPSMPESMFFSLPAQLKTIGRNPYGHMVHGLHTCPNGHIYFIGECTNPTEEAKCIDCGETIGGVGEKLSSRNERYTVPTAEESHTGYILDTLDKTKRNRMDNPEDRMTKQGVAFTRFVLHSCMLISVWDQNKVVEKLSRRGNWTYDSFVSYLFHQMQSNIDGFAQAISKNTDDAELVMHKIFEFTINSKVQNTKTHNWSSIESRKTWENEFRSTFLLKVLGEADQTIRESWSVIKDNSPIQRLVRDLQVSAVSSERMACQEPILWHLLQNPSTTHLQQFIMDNAGEQC